MDLRVQRNAGSSTIWASTGGPVVYSRDDGSTWSVLDIESAPVNFSKFLDFSNIKQIRIDPEGNIWMAHPHWIARSADGALTWEYVYPFPGGQMLGIDTMEILDGYLWVGCATGLVVRIDLSTRTAEEVCRTGENIASILPLPNNIVMIGTMSGVHRSADSGRSFVRFGSLPQASDLCAIDGSVWCNSGGIVYKMDSNGTVLWQSTAATASRIIDLFRVGGTIWCLAEGAGGAELVRIDATTSPNATTSLLGGTAAEGRIFAEEGGRLYVALPGKIAISTDSGNSWAEHPFGISTVKEIRSVDGVAWAGLQGGGVAQFDPSSQSWRSTFDFGNSMEALWMESSRRIFFATGCSFHSTDDGGVVFNSYTYDPSPEAGYQACLVQIAKTSAGRLYLLVKFEHSSRWKVHLYWSDSDGRNWSPPDVVYAGGQFPRWPRFCVEEKRGVVVITTNFGVYQKLLPDGAWTAVEELGQSYDCTVHGAGDITVLGQGVNGAGLYTLRAGFSSWDYSEVPSYYEDSRIVLDPDGTWWLSSHEGLSYREEGSSGWSTSTKSDGLSSNHLYSVYIEGSGSEKAIWVGSSVGASHGSY